MTARWSVILGAVALIVSIAGWTEAAPVNTCADSAGTEHIVDTALEASAIGANGYSNGACKLIINTSITPITINPLIIEAGAIEIKGPDVLVAGQRVEIIHPVGGGVIRIRTSGTGNIDIEEATIKATNLVRISCPTFPCAITIKLSELIASSTLAFGGPGGRLEVNGQGPVDVQTTTVWGGEFVNIVSGKSTVTFICRPGEGGCKDPTTSGVLSQLLHQGGPATCADQFAASQPCTVTFPTAADVKAVCIQAPGVQCGGASGEFHIIAELDIHIEGSQIDALHTFRIISNNGRLFAANAQLTATTFTIGIKGDGTSPSIDFSNASLIASENVRITAGSNCPAAPAICILLDGATVEGQEINIQADNTNGVVSLCGATLDDFGSDDPSVNGDSTHPFYTVNALDDAGECAGNPANVIQP
jgi:hypothetical protein